MPHPNTTQTLETGIAALNEALAQGERLVRMSDGRTVEYRSVGDIIAARDDLQRQLAALTTRRARQTYAVQGGRGF
nr:hypothetical protein [Zoogloeaceae bacterium]